MFRVNTNILICGASQSGKTTFLKKLIIHRDLLFGPEKISKVLYCYDQYQPENFDELAQDRNIEFYKGIPSEEKIKTFGNGQPVICAFDDLYSQLSPTFLEALSTRFSHHSKITSILLAHNIFASKNRTQRTNMHYYCLLKNPGDLLQYRIFGQQVYPLQLRSFLEAFYDATKESYGYLIVDLFPQTDDKLRLRTGIFPGETPICYIPKEK